MKNIIKLVLVAIIAVFMIQATCGKPKPVEVTVYEELEIEDWVYFHNMSITYDEYNYITLNGGNDGYCRINTYDYDGYWDTDYDLGIDGRTIFYDNNTSTLYAKVYGTDLYELSLYDEEATVKYSDIFTEDNSSVAFSPDGKYVYELNEKGYIRFIDLSTGDFEKQIKITTYNSGNGYLTSIAASDKYFFIWGASDNEVVVLNLKGKYVTTIELPRSGLGFSLSYCHNMLWIAEDADATTDTDDDDEIDGASGYWYGYSLTGLE